jgi:hypothetical protein
MFLTEWESGGRLSVGIRPFGATRLSWRDRGRRRDQHPLRGFDCPAPGGRDRRSPSARAWRLFTYTFGTALRGTCGRMGRRVSTAVAGPHIDSAIMTRRTHLKPFKNLRQHFFGVSLARRRYTSIPRTVPPRSPINLVRAVRPASSVPAMCRLWHAIYPSPRRRTPTSLS